MSHSPKRKDAFRWPLAIRLEVLPGESVLEKFEHAAGYGFDAIELPGRYLAGYRDELLACRNRLPLKISSISLGYRGSLISSDPVVRSECRRDIQNLLNLCAEIGAGVLVVPPLLNMDAQHWPAHARPPESASERDALLLDELSPLAEVARKLNVFLTLEPVNRFETSYLRTLAQASELCAAANRSSLGITADFFHMQIEELQPADAIRKTGKWLRHVHVADNTRVEPGVGSLNFRPGIAVLHEIGYRGYLVVECRGLSGPAEIVLPRCAQFLRNMVFESEQASSVSRDPVRL